MTDEHQPVESEDSTGAPDQPEESVGSVGEVAEALTDEAEVDGDDEAEVDGDDEASPGPASEMLELALLERTADLQRLQAEFLNYKRRVDRDRDLIRENATYVVLRPIIEVLDNIDRAREHGPLDDGFKAVAEQLERVVSGLGLLKFGEPGEAFDPTLHEALSHVGEDPDVSVPTAKFVAKSGYKIGDRVVRAAQVLVADPVSAD